MKTVTLILLCFWTSISLAQITTGSVKKRAEQKVENRANQKVDQAIDKGIDAIEGLFRKKKKSTGTEENQTSSTSEQNPSPRPSATKDIDFVASQNDFIGTVAMEYRFYKNDKEEKDSPMVIEMHLSKVATAMKMVNSKGPTSLFIMYLDQNKIIMVTDIESKGMAMEMKRPNLDKYDDIQANVEKTGNTRTIDGYSCQEYIITVDDQKTTAWTTKDITYDYNSFQKSMMAIAKMNPKSNNNFIGDIDGFPIEMISLSKNGKEKVVVTIKEFKEGSYDASLFDTSGLEIMKIPSFGN